MACAFLLLIAPCHAEEAARKIVHDSTEMTLKVDGNDLTIAYEEPPSLLREIGVATGQILVAGTWTRREPNVLVGRAYAFAPGCAPIAYEIRGVVDAEGLLVVIGPMPILKLNSCEVAEHAWTEGAVMEFSPPRPDRKLVEHKPRKKRAPDEQPKPKPKAQPKPRPAQPRQPQPTYPTYQQPWGWQQWR